MYIDGGPSRNGAVVEHSDRRLVRSSDGFEIRTAGRQPIRVRSSGSGWHVDGVDGGDQSGRTWVLVRATSTEGGFVLRGAGGAEVGRTMPVVGGEGRAGLKFLLLDDGRLFRIALRGPRDGGFELLGWETPGAYIVARPEPDNGWSLIPTAACGGLTDLQAISVLLASEILDSEEPLRVETK